MRNFQFLTLVAFASVFLSVGCSNPVRSRNLADSTVAASTLAQQVCANCHGSGGVAISPNFPNLAAQTEPYLVAQLNGFKDHSRRDKAGSQYMWGLSRSLTDKQIKGFAAYYAGQAPSRQATEGEPDRIALGKAIFEGGFPEKGVPACKICHGDQAQGLATFPRLAGQHANYLVKQLLVFRNTNDRPNGTLMKTIAQGLSEKNMEDVASYLQALPGL